MAPVVPRSLEDALRDGLVLPFAGAGVSMAVHDRSGRPLFPSWRGLLEGAADELEREGRPEAEVVRAELRLARPDLLRAAGTARRSLGGRWLGFLQSALDPPNEVVDDGSLALARAVWALGSPLVITTNFDRVLRWACPKPQDIRIWDVASGGVAEIQRRAVRRPTIWHLHGHLDALENMILTEEGYARLYGDPATGAARHDAALHTLRGVLAGHSLLFIGFSLADEHFFAQVRWVHERFGGFGGQHYVIATDADAPTLRHTLDGLPIDVLPVAGFGAPLLEYVERLGRLATGEPPPALSDDATPSPQVPDGAATPAGEPGARRPGVADYLERPDLEEDALERLDGYSRLALLHGPREIGRSTLIVRLAARWAGDRPDRVVVRVQLAAAHRRHLQTVHTLLGYVGYHLALALQRRGTPVPVEWSEDAPDVALKIGALVEGLVSAGGRLLLAIDDVDLYLDRHEALTLDFLQHLRVWVGDRGEPWCRVAFLLTARHPAERHSAATSPLANLTDPKRIGDLPATVIADRARACGLELSDADLRALTRCAGGHPALVVPLLTEMARPGATPAGVLTRARDHCGLFLKRTRRRIRQRDEALGRDRSTLDVLQGALAGRETLSRADRHWLDHLGVLADGEPLRLRCDVLEALFDP